MFRTKYHAAQSLSFVNIWPLQVDFELNYLCNFGCSFCPHGNEDSPQPSRSSRLTFEQFCKVIDEGKKFGLCSIKLNYINEPLANANIYQYIKYAKRSGVLNVYFATNGTLLSPEISRNLIEAGVSKIMISLDAATPWTFKLMRNSDQYDKVVSNVLALLDIRSKLGVKWPLVRVNFVKTERNIHELEMFEEFWKGRADMIGVEEQVGLPGVENSHVMPHSGLEDFGCSFPFKLVVVDSRGFILPCCTFSGREMPIGHIESHTIEQVWNSEEMRKLRNTHASKLALSNPICAHCLGVK